jgi:hypothetical protein
MSEQLLDHPEISSPVEKVSGIGVPEGVGVGG